MSVIESHVERLAWISKLEIPEAPAAVSSRERSAVVRASADENGAAVVKGSVVSFVSGLTDQARDDVQNSTLLMQLAADKKFDPDSQKQEWFKFYTEGLANLGWGRVSSVYSDYQPKNTDVTMDQVVLEVLAQVVAPESALYLVVAQTFEALKSNPNNQGALKLFDNSSTKSGTGTFQILPAAQDTGGNVIMVLTCVNATTTVQSGSFLFWHWSSSSSRMYRAAQQIVLNESVYKQVRQAVIDKLGDNAKNFVKDLDI
ncbi:hypothetical protein [Pseudomonas prosekii]|uniref:Uncharacterized protein n=1 Tax=Pseudomonas prosekii TaxID=1148509 RepID=A0A2U2D0I0_9PSED|nr:hypothetical protein [Pseudomonas prosekii]PWE38980.1 hypothetical protein C9I49_27075 [Pseudomonas prosekii]